MSRIEGPIPHAVIGQFYERLGGGAVSIVNSGVEAEPMVFLIALDEFGKALSFDAMPPELVNRLQRDAHSKEGLAAFMRAQLASRNADLIVHITETWMLAFDPKDETSMRRYKEIMSGGVRVGQMRQRKEALMVAMHTREGTCAAFMPIEDRRTTLVPLDYSQVGSPDFVGRLSLNPEHEDEP